MNFLGLWLRCLPRRLFRENVICRNFLNLFLSYRSSSRSELSACDLAVSRKSRISYSVKIFYFKLTQANESSIKTVNRVQSPSSLMTWHPMIVPKVFTDESNLKLSMSQSITLLFIHFPAYCFWQLKSGYNRNNDHKVAWSVYEHLNCGRNSFFRSILPKLISQHRGNLIAQLRTSVKVTVFAFQT